MAMSLTSTFVHEEEEVEGLTMKYLPINRLYSSTSPCLNPSGSSTIMSKKIKARKLMDDDEENEEKEDKLEEKKEKPLLVYSRRNKKPRNGDSDANAVKVVEKKYQLRGNKGDYSEIRKRSRHGKSKQWVELDFDGVDPNVFVGMACKVFWPMDEDWYKGSVTGYNSATRKHCIEYNDGDVEHLVLMDEKIKFYVSSEEMQNLNLKYDVSSMEKKGLNYNEMLALAASFDDCQCLEPGDLVWAKLTGHAMWPAVIVDESNVGSSRDLQLIRRDQSVLVQFFGTHDFARVNLKQAIPFLNGMISSLHLKCKQVRFSRSLEEAKLYLSNQQLPKGMLDLQKGMGVDGSCGSSGVEEEGIDSCDHRMEDMTQITLECSSASPLEIGNIRLTSLGKIVCDSTHFHDKKHIWPEGYTAFRMFTSIKDPCTETSYKMEVLRNPKARTRPLFRVTSDDGEQIDGPSPSACWKEIYDRIRNKKSNNFTAEAEGHNFQSTGSDMFGFKNKKIAQLIQDLPNSWLCTKYFESWRDVPDSYRAVRIDWKDLDRCSVCHTDEDPALLASTNNSAKLNKELT